MNAEEERKAQAEEARIMKEYAALEGKHEEERATTARRFDPHALITKARQIKRIEDPELGTIEYIELVLGDVFEANERFKDASAEQKTRYLIWKMLCKTYPDLKLEEIDLLPPRLIEVFADKVPFFSARKISSTGSQPAETPR